MITTFKTVKITRNSLDEKVKPIDKMLLNNSKVVNEDITEDELFFIECCIYRWQQKTDHINPLMPISKRLCIDFVAYDSHDEIYLLKNSWVKRNYEF